MELYNRKFRAPALSTKKIYMVLARMVLILKRISEKEEKSEDDLGLSD